MIARALDGDLEAFGVLYTQHKRRIFSLCLRMVRDVSTAEDLMQETFVAAFRKLAGFRGDSAFSTWLHRVAVNVALMHLRKRKSAIPESPFEVEDGEQETYEQIGTDDARLSRSLDRIALERAIDALAPGHRLIFVLHDVEGYEHTEIAQLLGCSVGNTKSQLHKARMKLRRVLMEGVARRRRRHRRDVAQPLPLAA